MNLFKRKFLIYSVVALLIVNLGLFFYFLTVPTPKSTEPESLKVVFLDVGQGDASLIQTEDDKNILIDGGPDKSIIYKLDQYIPFHNRRIDLMILTHPDPDHLNGLIEVSKRYKVKTFIFNGVFDESIDYHQFLKRMDDLGVKKEIVWQGKKVSIGSGYLEFLFPLENLTERSLKDDNEGSLVFKLVFGETKIIFTGDATQKVENQLIERGLNLSANVLKVGHHGSKSSTSAEFLSKVKPTYAVISVGKNNKFSHPNLRVLKNLENIQAQVLRTDQLGDIMFEIKRDEIKLNLKSKK